MFSLYEHRDSSHVQVTGMNSLILPAAYVDIAVR